MSPSMLAWAQRYRQPIGWSIMPLVPRGKEPLVSWQKFQSQRATASQITAWWRTWPTANVGVITGAISRLVVVDLDGPEGLAQREKFPVTATVTTAHGVHLYFRHPGGGTVPNSVKTVLPGVDIRGDGGFVVGPPSIHETGAVYTWESMRITLAPLPEWIVTAEPVGEARTTKRHNETNPPSPAGANLIPEGQRRDHLWRLGRSRRALGAGPGVIEDMLRLENLERCDPPLFEDELRKLIREVIERPDRT
jgi:hypothetical protein